MPTSYERLDVKDRAIAEAIVQNPRASVPWISKATGYPESTVNKHLSAMQQLDRLVLGRIIQVLNWRAVGYPLRYRVDLDQKQPAILNPPSTNTSRRCSSSTGWCWDESYKCLIGGQSATPCGTELIF